MSQRIRPTTTRTTTMPTRVIANPPSVGLKEGRYLFRLTADSRSLRLAMWEVSLLSGNGRFVDPLPCPVRIVCDHLAGYLTGIGTQVLFDRSDRLIHDEGHHSRVAIVNRIGKPTRILP